MSRTYAAQAKEQKQPKQKQEVVAIKSISAAMPMSVEQKADCLAELERFRQAARAHTKAFLMGSTLLFKKGAWVLGTDKIEIPNGTRYVALMSLARMDTCAGTKTRRQRTAVSARSSKDGCCRTRKRCRIATRRNGPSG